MHSEQSAVLIRDYRFNLASNITEFVLSIPETTNNGFYPNIELPSFVVKKYK